MDNHLYCNDTHGKSYKVLVSTKTHQTEQHPCWQSFICWFQCRKRRHFIDCVTCFLLWIFHCMHVLCNQSCYALLSCVFERKGVCSMRLSSKRRESLTHYIYTRKGFHLTPSSSMLFCSFRLLYQMCILLICKEASNL